MVALFSPEHGLQGKLDVANIDDVRDEATGLPTYSLYGKDTSAGRETPARHRHAGVRHPRHRRAVYTYLSTMGLAMEVAAERGLRFVVLDRPTQLAACWWKGRCSTRGVNRLSAIIRSPCDPG